eukprot:2647878-Alexandrium_andersonii.AAC.1
MDARLPYRLVGALSPDLVLFLPSSPEDWAPSGAGIPFFRDSPSPLPSPPDFSPSFPPPLFRLESGLSELPDCIRAARTFWLASETCFRGQAFPFSHLPRMKLMQKVFASEDYPQRLYPCPHGHCETDSDR